MKQTSDLTQESFDRLLSWLDPDRERAGRKYEEIRQGLVKVFTWRRCDDPEALADDTINRVALKVETLADTYTGDPALYFYGVARRVLLEHFKQSAAAPALRPPAPEPASEEVYECLETCVRKLPASDRELVVLYYEKEKQSKIDYRKELARGLNVEPNTLRVRMHRLRAALQRCIQGCLKAKGLDEMS